jgi:hypothetical protein
LPFRSKAKASEEESHLAQNMALYLWKFLSGIKILFLRCFFFLQLYVSTISFSVHSFWPFLCVRKIFQSPLYTFLCSHPIPTFTPAALSIDVHSTRIVGCILLQCSFFPFLFYSPNFTP